MLLPQPRVSVFGAVVLLIITKYEASAYSANQRPVTSLNNEGFGGNGEACRLPAIQSVYLSEGFDYSLDCAPSTGTLNAFMMFVDFPDAEAIEASPRSLYDVFLPEAADWYTKSSFGKLSLNVTADTSRFYRMPNTASSYGWQRGLTWESHRAYIQDAVNAFDGTHDFTDNHLLYIAPTKNAWSISFSPTFMTAVYNRNGQLISKKAVTFGQDSYHSWFSKVLNHETGHTMCLPDLYPFTEGRTGLYVGGWDLMGYINGPSPDHFAWNKWKLGWLTDDQIVCITDSGSSSHTVFPIEVAGGIKAVVVKQNATAALVAEVRSNAYVNSDTCKTGVLLYTVTTDTETGHGPIRVLDTNPNSGGCAGDELNDAPLTICGNKFYSASDWGVNITVTGWSDDNYTIKVDVA